MWEKQTGWFFLDWGPNQVAAKLSEVGWVWAVGVVVPLTLPSLGTVKAGAGGSAGERDSRLLHSRTGHTLALLHPLLGLGVRVELDLFAFAGAVTRWGGGGSASAASKVKQSQGTQVASWAGMFRSESFCYETICC